MKGLIKILFVFLFLGMCLSFVSASFDIGNLSHSIDKQYGPGDFIRGWVNISLSDELTNSVFSDGRGNSISLINLLRLNENFDYSCNIEDCESDYLASNGATTKSFPLGAGGSKILGFKIEGTGISIKSANLSIAGTAGASCSNQLKVDVLNDGEIDIGNTNPSVNLCARGTSCFDENKPYIEYSIRKTPYCQRIRFPEAPGFKIGATIKKTSSEISNLTAAIYDGREEEISCELPEANTDWIEVGCSVDHLVIKPRDYYICVFSNGSSNSVIQGYEDGVAGCGFYGKPVQDEIAAYNIFVQARKFGQVGELKITKPLTSGYNFEWLIQDYINEKYNGVCGTSGCVVPMKIISAESQTVTLSNLKIEYETEGGSPTLTNFHDAQETPAKVNAELQKLYLDNGNFSVQENFGNATFQLKLNNQLLFSEDIIIERIPTVISLTPTTVAAAYPTEFKVQVETHNSSATITNYKWEFGNGDTATTETNKVTYAYNSTGTFELKVTVTNSDGLSSSRMFGVVVETPIDAANYLLSKKLQNLNNIKSQIAEFPLFYQESLNAILDIATFDDAVAEIQRLNASASQEEDYINIVSELVNLNIPESITTSKTADSISFYPDDTDIELDVLQTIGGGTYDSESAYIDAILAWHQKNLETKITFKELSAKYEYLETPVLRIFEITINKKSSVNPYFVLAELEGLRFAQDYSEKNEAGYVYTKLLESQQTISFTTTEAVDFTNLPLFISPALNELSVAPVPEEGGISKWVIFTLIIILLIALGVGVYLFLQNWYKKKYESYLFKNRNDLYNMVTYVANSKKRGLENKKIESGLKKAGWSSEQVSYVMKKYAGKRTGMLEIPVEKILGRVKKKDIPQRRYGGEVPRKF